MPSMLDGACSCRWSELDVGPDLLPIVRCTHPNALADMVRLGAVDCFCMFPGEPCDDYEQASRGNQWPDHR